jgi:hypothetical protein
VHQYRAEARFLRALSYWHGLDLFGNIPLVTEDDPLGATPPSRAPAQAVYDYVVSELNAIRMPSCRRSAGQYGRADQGAAQMLLAKLYLNSAVYTGTPRYAEARAARRGGHRLGAVLAGPELPAPLPGRQPHLARDHLPDPLRRAAHADVRRHHLPGARAVGGNMNAANYGIDGGWWGLRVRPRCTTCYRGRPAGADLLHQNGQSASINSISNFTDGVGAPKYRNVTSGGARARTRASRTPTSRCSAWPTRT